MSLDRTCRMSDLNAAKAELRREQARLEREVNAVDGRMDVMETEQAENERKFRKWNQDLQAQRADINDMQGGIEELEIQQSIYQRHADELDQRIAEHEQHLAMVDQNVAENRVLVAQAHQKIGRLKQQAELARRHIQENDRQIAQLHEGVQQIQNELEAERERQAQERYEKRRDVAAQQQMALELKRKVEAARARFFGVYNEYLSALTTLDQADLNVQKGNLEVALSQFEQGQNILLKVLREIDEREANFESKRVQCQAALKQMNTELALANTEEMCKWYPVELEQIQIRLQALQARFEHKEFETAGEPVEVRMALEQLTLQAMQIYQDIRLLENKLLDSIARNEERKARARDILKALSRVWDQAQIPFDLDYIVKADPKSAILLQTMRPHPSPNVRVELELDGSVRFSWGGYEGMKCVEDLEHFEKQLQEQSAISIQILESFGRPDAPNPYGGGGGGGTPVIKPPTVDEKKSQTQRQLG